jgi:hypothetical protein
MSELDKLLQAYDFAIQAREAALGSGWTNYTPEQALRMVEDARQAILKHVAEIL